MRYNPKKLFYFFLTLPLYVLPLATYGQEDYTNRIAGAYYNEYTETYWTKSPANANGLLQYDTWSSRGSSDGSNMTTPFMEYWTDKTNNTLDMAEIRHQTISGLPSGRYQLQMTVRCYAENGNQNVQFSTYMYANGETAPIVADDSDTSYTRSTYGGQVMGYNTASLEFEVGTDGTLSFGLNINEQTNQNWVAWKYIKLYLLEAYDITTPVLAEGEPIEPGTYYIRNKANGKYVNAGGSYAVQAVFGEHPMATKLSKAYDTYFYFDSNFSNTDSGYHQWGISNGIIYVEGASDSYTLSVVSDGNGYFTIQSQDGYYIGYNDNDNVDTYLTNPTSDNALWEFITEEELVNGLLDGSNTDATFLITNPRFDRNYATLGWEGSPATGGNTTTNGNFCAEKWNCNFDVYQKLENIPNGTYRLSCQGFYRYNNNAWNNTNANSSRATTNQLYAKLYAGSNESSLQNITTEISNIATLGLTVSGNGMPFSLTESANTFTAGLYSGNTVDVNVTDHTLTIGVKKETLPGVDWTVFDNFELTLLSLGDNSDYDMNGNSGDDDTPSDASFDNPIDMTSKLVNPSYSNGTSGWTGSPTVNYECAEKYNTTYNVYQTVTGLQNGWYKVTAQGFYRYGAYTLEEHNGYAEGGWGQNTRENDANNIYAVYTIPYAVITHEQGIQQTIATMYANNVEQLMPSPLDDTYDAYPGAGNCTETKFGWVPNDMQSASKAFEDGKYPMEIIVPVTDGTLKIGMKKSFGYKYDWAIWDNFNLYYLGTENFQFAESVTPVEASVNLTVGEKHQLTATVFPENSSDKTIKWTSSNTSVATVDANGLVKAVGTGSANIIMTAVGSDDNSVTNRTSVVVSSANGNASNLIINEILVSNLDMFIDPSYNYGGYVELYNPTGQGVSLNGLYVSMDAANLKQFQLNSDSGIVPANGYGLIWFDHNDAYNGNVDDHLDMDGGTVYISDSNGNLLISQEYPAAISRVSYSRTTDGGNEWAFTAYPTPGKTNTESLQFIPAGNDIRLVMPEVDVESKTFDSPFNMNVSIPSGSTLYYTLDGSTPSESNGEISADGTFNIDKTTILRLRLFKSGKLPSPVRTLSYIYRDKDYMLPVLSLVADPINLYSDSLGVFTTGKNGVSGSGIDFPCNWNMEWDRPAAYNFITADNSETYGQEVNLKRFGGWSRSWYPFNFKLKASSLYENQKYMEYPFFENKPHLRHKVLQVRNGGNDLQCRIKDAALQYIIISSGFYLDCQDYMPVHSFVNGHYQGMLNLREPSNKHFSLANYGIDTDEVDQMELGGGITVNAGDIEEFNRWRSLSSSSGENATYETIKSFVDVDEFINYMATQMFLGGDDWPGNNCKAFKGKDGKFHIVLFDIDQALRFNAYAFTHITNNSGCPLVNIFLNMMNNNAEFRKQFIDTFCIVGGSVFEPTRSIEIINRIAEEMNPALLLEGLSTEPTAGYVRALMTAERRNTMMNGLKSWSYANLSSATAHTMKLSSNIDAATLQLNNINIPTAKFDGTMFSPAVIKASAPEGYVFQGWIDENNNVISQDEEFDISSLGNLTLVATYERMGTADELFEAIATPIKVNEVSAGNTVFANEFFKKNDWFELFNNTDEELDVAGLYVSNDINNPLKYQIPTNSIINTIVPAGGHIIVWADELKGESQIHSNFKLDNLGNNTVVVTSSEEFVNNNSEFYDTHPDLQAFVDGMTYIPHRGDNSVGRYPDGGYDFYLMRKPTIERTNLLTQADSIIGHDVCLMNPDANKFRLELVEGWNWISHNLNVSITPSSLTEYSERIVAQKTEAVRDNIFGMVGNLKALNAGNLYKVKMSQDDTFEYEGLKCNSEIPIKLIAGWNWIGYTVTGAQTISAALGTSLQEEGDHILGQDGFASFSNGQWTGSLSQFETGKGYMYKSKSAKTIRFHASEVQVNFSKRKARALNSQQQKYQINKYAKPNVMGVIAKIDMEGMELEQERFTILAYSDNEYRGVSECVDSLLYITIYGDGGEDIKYVAIDNLDGSIYKILETDCFALDVIGSKKEPRKLTIKHDEDESTGIEAININDENGQITTNKVEGYFSLGGQMVSHRAASLKPGIYIVKYENGKCEKVFVK